MATITLYESDFRKSQDYPHESLFECILRDLKIPEEEWSDIESIEVDVSDFEIEKS